MLEKPIQDPLAVPGAIRAGSPTGSSATALERPYLAAAPTRDRTMTATAANTEPASTKLYHFPTSLCSQKVRIALEEKGVAWDSHLVNIGPAFEQYEPWYVVLNPRMVVPTLELGNDDDDDEPTIITSSRAILEAIDARFDGPSLIPDGEAERAQMDHWLDAQDELSLRELTYAKLPGIAGWLLRHSFRSRLKRLEKLRKANEEHAELYTAKIADVTGWRDTISDKKRVAELLLEVEAKLDEMERVLGQQEFLAGDEYSLADSAWMAVLGRLDHLRLGYLWQDGARPRVAAYLHRMRGRSSSLQATNTLDTWQKIKLVARVVLPKLIMAWLIKVAVFWIGARVIELLAQ